MVGSERNKGPAERWGRVLGLGTVLPDIASGSIRSALFSAAEMNAREKP